jgi:hypothetical protein
MVSMSRKREYDRNIVVDWCIQAMHTQDVHSFKEIYEIISNNEIISNKVPSYIVFTRIIREYIGIPEGSKITLGKFIEKVTQTASVSKIIDLCTACGNVYSLDTNNHCLFIRAQNNYLPTGIANALKHKFKSDILATICDYDTVIVICKDEPSKDKISQLIESVPKQEQGSEQ